MNSLAQILVLIGLTLLAFSLKPSFKICQLPTEQQRGWKVLFVLICAFVFGYLSFFILLIGHNTTQLEIVVAAVFCGGGGFVFIITKMSQKTIHLLIISVKKSVHQAHHDELTRLPNRVLFYQDMAARIQANQIFCCMILDLNEFKKINDTLGHHCGDLVLTLVAKRIQTTLPPAGMVARLGGDELGILLPGSYQQNGMILAQQLQKNVSQEILYEGRALFIGVSIGIAEFPQLGNSREQLLKHADIAMYHAKRNKMPYMLYKDNLTF